MDERKRTEWASERRRKKERGREKSWSSPSPSHITSIGAISTYIRISWSVLMLNAFRLNFTLCKHTHTHSAYATARRSKCFVHASLANTSTHAWRQNISSSVYICIYCRRRKLRNTTHYIFVRLLLLHTNTNVCGDINDIYIIYPIVSTHNTLPISIKIHFVPAACGVCVIKKLSRNLHT